MTCNVSPSGPLFAGVVLSLLAAGCASSGSSQSKDGEWLQASPMFAQQIEDQISRLPWTHGTDRIELIGWLASAGEPAYEGLLELCLDPRDDVAGSALAALGATGDSRLVESIHGLDWPAELNREVRLERARALVRLGDWSKFEALINGLADEELWARAWCIQALEEATNQRFGFDPRGEPGDRAEAVGRWKAWYDSRTVEGVLGA